MADTKLLRSAGVAFRRALVAEDNDINALIAQKALRRLGFETVRAADGDEALQSRYADGDELVSVRPDSDGCEDARA